MPYDPDYPVVCMDESCKQMIGEVRVPTPCAPGQPIRIDDEYVRNGVAEIFMEVEPLAGKRHAAVTEHRTRKDWAMQIEQMLDERYSNVIKVRLVMDNLNTHNIASLYETFEPKEARRLAERLDPLHPETRQLAEYGGDRTQRSERTMSRSPDSRHGNHADRSGCTGKRPK